LIVINTLVRTLLQSRFERIEFNVKNVVKIEIEIDIDQVFFRNVALPYCVDTEP